VNIPDVGACPDCGKAVIKCDNNIFLDHPAEEWDGGHVGWTIMQLGGMNIASNGDPGLNGKAHRLHEHQPPESVMA